MDFSKLFGFNDKLGIFTFFGLQFHTDVINKFIIKFVMIVIILILVLLIIKFGNKLIDKIVEKQSEINSKFSINEKRANTLGTLLKSILKYSAYFFGILMMIGIIIGGQVPLAFASVGGVAIGLGAQSFVKDLINGIFILFEEQYSVGDYVTIDKYTGIVESIEIRTTTLREFSGAYHIIPNGLISVVSNHSKGNMQINVYVSIAYEESIDNAINVIKVACEKFANEHEDVTKAPIVRGVTDLGASGMTIRVLGEAKPMTQWNVEAELRKVIKEALDEAGIEIPYNKLQVIK
ncbi:mechanosensitive ion channel family protein [Clostridium mediterraneense]|uniref:mechanosensitive ion channel family protein n=1 Tax=Clostridium mediterraneense TaxID=1805472 RepID=UPI000834B6CE|nr:mechanosensitive ion channel family protein [Clostridium mediterraneense]